MGLRDIFELAWAADPQISPDGTRVVFARSGFDIMTDRTRCSLWSVSPGLAGVRLLDFGLARLTQHVACSLLPA